MPKGVVDTEFVFWPLPEHELRVADVPYVCVDRERAIDPEDNLRGAPDVVIEVLSPSNTISEIYGKEKLCLENGAQEFWAVDPDLKQVKISPPDGRTTTYKSGQEISLPLFGGGGDCSRCHHVYLFVSIPPRVTISRLLQWLKGKTAHRLMAKFAHIKKQFWGRHMWARGYLCCGSGNVTDEVIAKYIADQNIGQDEDFRVDG